MSIKFVKTTDKPQIAEAIADRLSSELSNNKKVLWLVSGGSNIQLAVEIMKQIPDDLSQNLTVSLIDERFGEVGHADSNWQQLLDAGINFKQAKAIPILDGSKSLNQNAENHEKEFREMLAENDVKIGLFGMGADGHTSGILPETVAARETSDDKLIVGYQDKFARITTTFAAVKKIDIAFLVAFGEDKRPAMENLKKKIPLEKQPAQILKQISETTVFSDILTRSE